MAMIHNCPLHTVLISTIGKTPQVLVETVWSLANQKNPIVPDEIIAVSMANFAEDARESVFGKGAGWKKLISNLRKSKIAIAEKLKFKEITVAADGKGPIDDLRTTEDNMRCADYMFELIRKYTFNDSTRIILSLSGGRKSLSALATVTMSLLARPQDSLIHLIVDSGIENDGQYHFPRGGKGYSLFEIPFVRTRGLLVGVDLAKMITYKDCVRRTQKSVLNRDALPTLTVDASNWTLQIGEKVIPSGRIDPCRFFLLWLIFSYMRLNRPRFEDAICSVHQGKISEKDFWVKCPKWIAYIRAKKRLPDMAKLVNETKGVLHRFGVDDTSIELLFPRPPNHYTRDLPIEYPSDRICVRESDFSSQLKEKVDALPVERA